MATRIRITLCSFQLRFRPKFGIYPDQRVLEPPLARLFPVDGNW